MNETGIGLRGIVTTEAALIPAYRGDLANLKEDLETGFREFVARGGSLFESGPWDPDADARYLLDHLASLAPSPLWSTLLQDPSLFQDECLVAQVKNLFSHCIVEMDMSAGSIRFLVAISEHLKLFSPMEFLDRRKGAAFSSWKRREICAPLLKWLIQNRVLEKGWMRRSFPNRWEASSWVGFFVSVLLELDEDKIEEYAKECSFYFNLEESTPSPLYGREQISSLWHPYGGVCQELYKQTKRSRELFLQSLGVPLNAEMLEALFVVGEEECIDPVYLTIDLSEEARGFLLLQLLVDKRDVYRDVYKSYIEELLRRGKAISICDWRIFLLSERNPEKKKERLQLLLQIIKNPNVTHFLPMAWIVTLVAYLFDLEIDLKPYGEIPFLTPHQELGISWMTPILSKEPFLLTEEDHLFLGDVIHFLAKRGGCLGKKGIHFDACFENVLPLLQMVFITLDKFRLSAEILVDAQQKKAFVEKTEELMTELLNCFSLYAEPIEEELIEQHIAFEPYKLVNSLLRSRVERGEIQIIMESLQRVDKGFYPLMKPFLRSLGAFQKGGFISKIAP